jgi:putative FmdB family regulatory protein
MVNHSYECPKCNHTFDKIVKWDQRYAKCPECGKRAERSWTKRAARRFQEPIVLHKYADGQWGVPAMADAKTPPGAERIECWHMADYERALNKMNASERARAQHRHDEEQAMREERGQAAREEIKYRLSISSSPWEKEMLRETLERRDNSSKPFEFRPFYNEMLER